jgi:hypothetical protein
MKQLPHFVSVRLTPSRQATAWVAASLAFAVACRLGVKRGLYFVSVAIIAPQIERG